MVKAGDNSRLWGLREPPKFDLEAFEMLVTVKLGRPTKVRGRGRTGTPPPSGPPNPGAVFVLQLSISPIYIPWGAAHIEG